MAALKGTAVQTSDPGGWIEPLVKWALGTLILLVVNQLVALLPMLEDLTIDRLPLTPLALIHLVVKLAILGLLLITARELGSRLRAAYPGTPQWGQAVHLLGLFLVTAWAHQVLLPLAEQVVKESLWVYHLVFAALAVAPFAILVTLLFCHLPQMAAHLTEAGRALLSVNPQVRCTACSQFASERSRFCPSCGTSLAGGSGIK